MRRILVLPPPKLRADLFEPPILARLNALGEIIVNPNDRNYTSEELADLIPGMEACITSWGSPKFTDKVVAKADSLRVIVHAAGSVKGLIGPEVFDKGIAVCTSQPAMGISVAAMTVAMMEIMLRNVVNLASAIRSQRTWRPEGLAGARELSGKVVGIVGASLIGRLVIQFIQPWDVELRIFDPYLSADEAESLGAKLVLRSESLRRVVKVSLEEIFAECDVISVHAPLTEETRGMITREHLRLIKAGAVLINTSRGAIIDHEALLDELKTGRFSAALDVTDPEPLPNGHEFFGLENVVFTPHISGGTPEMKLRQGEAAVKNLELFLSGETPYRLVTKEMLATMA